MLFSEDLWQFLCLEGIATKTRASVGSTLQAISNSMTNRSCQSGELDLCRDEPAARVLKFVAMASILLAGVAGVAIPPVGRRRRFLRTDGSLFAAAKAFAAGVILATGFVHMLSGGSDALTDPCLPDFPWAKFPFSGFFAMISALATLLVDVVGTQYYQRKHQREGGRDRGRARVGSDEADVECNGDKEDTGGTHIERVPHGHGHGHSHGFGDGDEDGGVRHVVVSQVLELGIVSHSVIIGLSLGVSQSPCTIRPLIAALSFHQFFEGFALGGCISQAQFETRSAMIMAFFFAVTTPVGIGVGTAIASFYNPFSTGALVTEGILDSLSAGILVYMALVDLIAADFLSKRVRGNFKQQLVSFAMLFLGAGLMSSLAVWA